MNQNSAANSSCGKLPTIPIDHFEWLYIKQSHSTTIHQTLPSGKLTQLWKITIFNGKTHYKRPFSIAMLNYQRVPSSNQMWLAILLEQRAKLSKVAPCLGPWNPLVNPKGNRILSGCLSPIEWLGKSTGNHGLTIRYWGFLWYET